MAIASPLSEIRKEQFIPTLSEKEAEAEFNRNTTKIMNTPCDNSAERVLTEYFGGLCQAFVNNNCIDTSCKKPHEYPAVFAVRAALSLSPPKMIVEAYNVIADVRAKNSKMYEEYFKLFAELFIKRDENFKDRLARMVMDCEITPRLTKLYKDIVDALVCHGQWQFYKAIAFIIEHHIDSSIAQEIILDLIVKTGPHLIRLLPYLLTLSERRTIPINILDEVIKNCVTFQDPRLPMFCLNNMVSRTSQQLNQLTMESRENFINLLTLLSEINVDLDNKLETVSLKL